MKNKYFQCISDTFPALRKNMNEIRRMTAAIGHGMYSECDLLAVLTVQRLFLVEAANLDSQTVFEGVVHIPYIIKNKESSYYAINSKTESNTIVLRKSKVTKQFMKNDCVALLENWKDYKNTPDICQRTIIKIEDIDDETFEVTFSGVPMDIIEGQTGLTCLPRKNGDTDDLCYHSGKCDMPSGHASFKYRHIENFWGSLSILLENVTVCNNEMTIQYPDGTTKKLGYQLPAQDIILLPKNFGAPTQMCIKEMGYDKTQPLLMLPSVIGDGASTSTYYCDAWYNMAEEDVTYLVSYGGAWDNRGYAGIFDFRAGFNEEERIPFNGSRMMIR